MNTYTKTKTQTALSNGVGKETERDHVDVNEHINEDVTANEHERVSETKT